MLYQGFDCSHAGIPQPGRDAAILYLKTAIGDLKIPPAAAMMSVFADTGLRQVMVTGYGRTGERRFSQRAALRFQPDPGFFLRKRSIRRFAVFHVSGICPVQPCHRTFAAAKDSCDGDSGGPVYWISRAAETARARRAFTGSSSASRQEVSPACRSLASTACGGGGIYTAVGDVELLGWLAANGAPLQVGSGARDFALETITDHGGGASPGTFKSSK